MCGLPHRTSAPVSGAGVLLSSSRNRGSRVANLADSRTDPNSSPEQGNAVPARLDETVNHYSARSAMTGSTCAPALAGNTVARIAVTRTTNATLTVVIKSEGLIS